MLHERRALLRVGVRPICPPVLYGLLLPASLADMSIAGVLHSTLETSKFVLETVLIISLFLLLVTGLH